MPPRQTLSALILVTAAAAQTPTVTHYGASCPAGTALLATAGAPRLGDTFLATGIARQMGCTLRACLCNCCLCNNCGGPSFLFLGKARSSAPVVLPGLIGDGCTILASPDVTLMGDVHGNVAMPIPVNARLLGMTFDLQRVDTLWQSTLGSNCANHFVALRGVALSDGVECQIGL
jgi:hypothetical protein